jgi:hypothetical protein
MAGAANPASMSRREIFPQEARSLAFIFIPALKNPRQSLLSTHAPFA